MQYLDEHGGVSDSQIGCCKAHMKGEHHLLFSLATEYPDGRVQAECGRGLPA